MTAVSSLTEGERAALRADGIARGISPHFRMLRLEQQTRLTVGPNGFLVMRLDGRGFKQYTRHLIAPFDEEFAGAMNDAAIALMKDVHSPLLAFVASDEMTIVATDLGSQNAEHWFGGVVQKIASVSAALVTVHFNHSMSGHPLRGADPALFDCRVYPRMDAFEVMENLAWRQRDTKRNAISMAGRTVFGHKELLGRKSREVVQLLGGTGSPYEALPAEFRYGRLITRRVEVGPHTYTHGHTGEEHTVEAARTVFDIEPMPDIGRGEGHTVFEEIHQLGWRAR